MRNVYDYMRPQIRHRDYVSSTIDQTSSFFLTHGVKLN